MLTNWFVVIRVLDHWWIDNEGRSFGPFATWHAACSASSRIARDFADRKRRSMVYWPDESGQHHLLAEGF